MELVRLVAPLRRRFDVARLSGVHPLLFRCSDADTVITTASLAGHLVAPIGVWLIISKEYPAQLAARDVAVLSGAYNRPAPPSPITVWSSEGTSLSDGDVLLTPRRVESTDVGEITYFA